MTTTNISLSALASECATSLLQAKNHEDSARAFKESANVTITKLFKAKATVGRKGSCATATAFYDTLVSGGLAKGTANNYLSVFREAVKTGKPVVDWNPNRKGKAVKGKAPKKDRENPAMDALFKLIKTDGGMDVLEFIVVEYDDAKGSITEIVIDLLKAEGYKIEGDSE